MGPLPGMGPLGIYGLPGFGLASGLNVRGVRTRGIPITGQTGMGLVESAFPGMGNGGFGFPNFGYPGMGLA